MDSAWEMRQRIQVGDEPMLEAEAAVGGDAFLQGALFWWKDVLAA